MKFSIYILYFLVFSFIGWIIDSGYRSLHDKKITNAGYFRQLPICPIYGFGGIILVTLFKFFKNENLFLTFIIAAITMVLVEYVGGLFCDKILNQRLWNYSNSKFNLHGHISLLQSFFWTILVIIFYFFFLPQVLIFEKNLNILSVSSSILDIIISTLFCLILLTITVLNKTKKSERRQ